MQARCVECHRAGEIGPFELTSYEEAAGWGEMMAEVVRQRRMPPWHANPKHGSFANDRSMPAKEKELLCTWVKNGCPEGDPSDLPAPRQFTTGWQLPRQPDLVLSMQEPFTVPADGGRDGVPYQHFRVPSGFTEDKWIAAAEVQPGNRSVVHHTIVYVLPPNGDWQRDRIFLAAYVPGLRFDPLPAGSAKRVPAGSTLVFEMHYTPNGSVQQDKTEIGLVFADLDQIDKELITTEIGDLEFVIPPGAASHVVTATSRPTKQEVTLLSLSPHMHVRGKSFRYELVLPTGDREVLLDVPAYDFNWQTRYLLAEPRQLPAGSVIHLPRGLRQLSGEPGEPRSHEIGSLGRSDLGRDDARLFRRDPTARRRTQSRQKARSHRPRHRRHVRRRRRRPQRRPERNRSLGERTAQAAFRGNRSGPRPIASVGRNPGGRASDAESARSG